MKNRDTSRKQCQPSKTPFTMTWPRPRPPRAPEAPGWSEGRKDYTPRRNWLQRFIGRLNKPRRVKTTVTAFFPFGLLGQVNKYGDYMTKDTEITYNGIPVNIAAVYYDDGEFWMMPTDGSERIKIKYTGTPEMLESLLLSKPGNAGHNFGQEWIGDDNTEQKVTDKLLDIYFGRDENSR